MLSLKFLFSFHFVPTIFLAHRNYLLCLNESVLKDLRLSLIIARLLCVCGPPIKPSILPLHLLCFAAYLLSLVCDVLLNVS